MPQISVSGLNCKRNQTSPTRYPAYNMVAGRPRFLEKGTAGDLDYPTSEDIVQGS